MEDNIMKWEAIIFGPEDSPWESGIFYLTLDFTEDYPNKPPQVKFQKTIFHPNVKLFFILKYIKRFTMMALSALIYFRTNGHLFTMYGLYLHQ